MLLRKAEGNRPPPKKIIKPATRFPILVGAVWLLVMEHLFAYLYLEVIASIEAPGIQGLLMPTA